MSTTDPNIIFLLIIVFIVVVSFTYSYGSNCSVDRFINDYTNTNNGYENFSVDKSNCSDAHCKDTSLLKIGNNMLLPPVHYMSTNSFNKLVIDLRFLIISQLKQQASMCNDMGGSLGAPDRLQKTHMTFNCINDIEGVQDIVLNRVATYIIGYGKYAYNINMNPQLIIKDFAYNLDLMNNVVYPLLYSRRYTAQGINYFTEEMLVDKVVNNLNLQDVLITTLQRRGIEVIPDTDNHI